MRLSGDESGEFAIWADVPFVQRAAGRGGQPHGKGEKVGLILAPGMEPWTGAPDPPDLQRPWGLKPKFSVNGQRSCAELAVLDHLRRDGWDGVWVSAFDKWLRSEWFPAPGFRTLAEAGAPVWAVEVFERLLAANDGKLTGFFDVFAWREPDDVRFLEVKVAGDRIQPTQRRFVERALRLHDHGKFLIIDVPG